MFQATNGILYGTTASGGMAGACGNGCGSVYSLSLGLGPFLRTQPRSAKIGATVDILGNNLTGASSVTFNGTAATFKVMSSSLITATVPAGATSGKIAVVTPGGTLMSSVAFRVYP